MDTFEHATNAEFCEGESGARVVRNEDDLPFPILEINPVLGCRRDRRLLEPPGYHRHRLAPAHQLEKRLLVGWLGLPRAFG